MQISVPYFYKEQATDSLVVSDIGNTCISAYNDAGNQYYLCIFTDYGVTRILEYGPYCNGDLPLKVIVTFDQFDYNEKKIAGRIDKFLNTTNRLITQAFECEYDEIKQNLINPKMYLQSDDE